MGTAVKYFDPDPALSYLRSSKYSFYLQQCCAVLGGSEIPFAGWGRKRSGRTAVWLARLFRRDFLLMEDGFVRSIGLGVDGFPSFCVVEDGVGIYYDATRVSKLEQLLNSDEFGYGGDLMQQTEEAMRLLRHHRISKYNSADEVDEETIGKYGLQGNKSRVLLIIQTEHDASLRFGYAEEFSTEDMLEAAARENPEAELYAKMHPDVLSGKKRSDIDIAMLRQRCRVIDDDLNPLSLLEYFDRVYTKTSQMGFEALLLGKECVCFGMPFYAGWGVTDDRVSCMRRKKRRSVEEIFAAAYIKYSRYFDTYSKKESHLAEVIRTISRYRSRDRKEDADAYCFGFSLWKHTFVKAFLRQYRTVRFIHSSPDKSSLELARRKGLSHGDRIFIWGKKHFEEVELYAKRDAIPLYRVEDGFIRSVGLGSDLTQPYSLVVDRRGIYFDPTRESDLEHILNTHRFDTEELERAGRIRRQIIESKISKYNHYRDVTIGIPEKRRIALVPGQVEDDASMRYGAPGMSNLKLLQKARESAPDAYIIFKPHPDVLAGNRIGQVARKEALRYCDQIVEEASLDSVLSLCDEVHTMTSLVGFESIMRGIRVYTYGMPFYAGWGLSIDRESCPRRSRELSLDELVAGTLLLYPRYLDPADDTLCEIEVTLERIGAQREAMDASLLSQLYAFLYSRFSRYSQRLIRIFQ